MPIINMPTERLVDLVNRDRESVSAADLPALLERMGIEVEEIAQTRQYVCNRCERTMERTAAQGAPIQCPTCGADYRENPKLLKEAGVVEALRLNMLAVRPDIFDAGGMARYCRGFLGVQRGLIEYPLDDPRLTVRVDPALARDTSLRPRIACAVLRNLTLDADAVRYLMNLQEDLHWALGRDRKLASIGVYDLDKVAGTRLDYTAVAPDGVKFVPLGFPLNAPDAALTPAEILEKHKTGQAYAHLLKNFTAYPLLRDEQGGVLSMPPIINSEATRVTVKTKACFVDVTGMAQRTVDRALAILVTGVKELMPAAHIERVTIEHTAEKLITPDLNPTEMTLALTTTADTLGARIDFEELLGLLQRMGHGVQVDHEKRVRVKVPAWRNDVMHPVDLIEDVAIAYGYDNLIPTQTTAVTLGQPRRIEEQAAMARRVLTGLGFHQVMTLTLTCENAAFERWRLPVSKQAVTIENPISSEQTMARMSLLPGLLETLAINKRYDLPQQFFEVGNCCFVDPAAETGASERRMLAAALIGSHVGYADIRAVADAVSHELQRPVTVRATEHPSLIRGRAAALWTAEGEALGIMGELHPEVLEAYGLKHPAAVLELDLGKLLGDA